MAHISEGDGGLGSAFMRFEEKVETKIKKKIIAETAAVIMSQAKALAPVFLGNLKASINVQIYDGGLSARVHVDSDYAIYVEYGTGIYATKGSTAEKIPWVYYDEVLGQFVETWGMEAQPFWHPAIESGANYFKTAVNML